MYSTEGQKSRRQVTCCFTGHRPDKLGFGYDESRPQCIALKQSLIECVQRLIKRGYAAFICGMAQGSDIFFAEAVLSCKRTHAHIRLIAAIPYRGQERRWSPAYQRRYKNILSQADEAVVLEQKYVPGCMMRRNRYMVDHASLLIAVYGGESGGTKNTLAYAVSQDLEVLWLNPQTFTWACSHRIVEGDIQDG